MFRISLLTWVVLCVLAVSLHAAQPQTGQPKTNVLLIMTDDQNADLGCYEHPLVKTPNIDRLAQQGMLFQKAYCQYPVCNPSRSSMLTGLYPEQTGVLNNGANFRKRVPNVRTLPQWFQDHGYYVARVGKIFHYGVPNQIGTDGADDKASWMHVVNPRGIDREVQDRIHTLQKGQFGGTLSWLNLESRDEEHTDGLGATAAIRLLEEQHPAKTNRPFFLAVGFYRPHTPYVAPSHYFDLYPRDRIEPTLEKEGDRADIPVAALADRPKQRELTVAQRKEIIQAYYASTSLMDAQVGRVLAALDRLQLSDSTVVVFVSDHGYHLGAHGLWQKGDLFEGSCRVPLIIRRPGKREVSPGGKIAAPTEMVDLYPTLVDLCGLPRPPHLMGESLRPLLEGQAADPDAVAFTVANSRAGWMHRELRGKQILGHTIRTPRYRYTEWNAGEFGRELYDYESDPEEYDNLAERAEYKQLTADLSKRLAAARERNRSTPKLGDSP